MDAPDAGGLVTVALALLLWAQAEVRAWRNDRDRRHAERHNARLASAVEEATRLMGEWAANAAQRLDEVEHPAVRRLGAAMDRMYEEVMLGRDSH